MRPRSAKAKGKRLQNKVTQLLQEKFSAVLEDGDFKFAVQSRNDNLSIVLKNNSHLPSNFINANWEGYYVTQSQDI